MQLATKTDPASLELERVKVAFEHQGEETVILNYVSLRCIQGKSYALVGASGSGKSTLLQLLGGISMPQAGVVRYCDMIIANYTPQELLYFRRHAIGFVFQEPMLIPECSVAENVALKGLIMGLPRAQCEEDALKLLHEVGLAHKADCFPLHLSGGEQHRVSIARALFSRPTFLLLDEPTAHLDASAKAQTLELIERIRTNYPIGMISATHDQETASCMDEQWLIKQGTLFHER